MNPLLGALRESVAHRRMLAQIEHSAPRVRIDHSTHIRSPSRLSVGADVFIDAGVVLHCGGMDWGPPDGGITIGEHSYVGPGCTLFGAAGIEIGASVLISPGVVITSHQHSYGQGDLEMRRQPLRFGRVVIEDDVWIGANATVLPGVRLATGSIVGAGAVVTRDVPARSIALGVPARVARER
jgi:acetyltransferase-like isoleucine patch superfamily enzyme